MYACIFAYSKNGFEECKKKNVRQSNTIDFWMHLVKRKKAKERKQRRASVKKKKGKALRAVSGAFSLSFSLRLIL